VQTGEVKRSIDLDDDLAAEIDRAATLVREKPATVIRLALRVGLSSVANRFQAPRPEGYFADAYKEGARAQLEDTIAKATIQRPER
jgi:Arc/MetJ family transcription regulator